MILITIKGLSCFSPVYQGKRSKGVLYAAPLLIANESELASQIAG
jgi:hypothetical protein